MEFYKIMVCSALLFSVCLFAIDAAYVNQDLRTPPAQSVEVAAQQEPSNRLKRSWRPTIYSYARVHLYPYAYAAVPYYRTITLRVTHPLEVLRRGVENILFGRRVW